MSRSAPGSRIVLRTDRITTVGGCAMGAKLPSVETVFGEAMELAAPAERAAFLDRACGGDATLRRQVESLLDAHTRAGGFLESPAATPTITLAARPPAEGPGAAIGPYRLLEEIGEGGMGVVYMAEQTAPVRRRVALKVIKPGMDSKQVVARFEAERQALALMDHPNIAKVHDAGATDSGRPYFVMELVRGLPITEYCDREGLTVPERLELFVLVCRAVQHAHQKGVIHRDLKPSNVLVTVVDGVPTPKVIDFGVAKATGGSLTDRTLFTGFHQMVGTPLYMSPEQADLSSADVDTRSDIYALGVLLYELLTGSTPFDRDTFAKAAFDEMRRMIREDEPPTPSTRLGSLGQALTTVSARRGSDPRRLNRAVRGDLDWIAMKALEKDRRRRYETANDFAADVMRYLTDLPVEACPPSARYRLGKYARRHRAALTTAVLVALSLLAGTAISTWQAMRAVRAEATTAAALRGARQAVDEMYTQVAEKWIAEQPSLTTLQREFLEKALAFYEQFSADGRADPEVRHEAIRARNRVGVIRHSLGRHAEAEAAFRQAVALGAALLREYPDRREWRLVIAEARLKLAALYREAGKSLGGVEGVNIDVGGAVEFASKSHEGQTRDTEREIGQVEQELAGLRTAIPADAAYRRRLAEAYTSLSGELTLLRRLPEAQAAVQAALEIWESLVREFPAEFDYRFGLAKVHLAQGVQRMWWGDQNEKAEAALRQADALLSALRKERPGDVRLRASLANTLLKLGVVLGWREQQAEGEAVTRRAVTLGEGLVADFPDVPAHHVLLSDAFNNLSLALPGRGRDATEAEECLRKALALKEGLFARHPDVPEYEKNLGDGLRALSSCLRQRGKLAEAWELHERALARARAFRKVHPELRTAVMNLGNALLSGMLIAVERGDEAAAAGIAEEWSRSTLGAFTREQLGEPLVALCASQLESPAEAKENAGAPPGELAAIGRANLLMARALIRESLRLGLDDPRTLSRLSDLLAMAPEGSRDPDLALRLARRAFDLAPKDGLVLQSLGYAQYRAGDWKGCVESQLASMGGPDGGDGNNWFPLAAAYGRMGDEARARSYYDLALAWLPGYEARCADRLKHEGTTVYPEPAMLRRFQAEVAALIRVTPPEAGPPLK